MTEGPNPNGTNDGLQSLVTALAEAMYNEPGDKPVPMATTDPEAVLQAQFTENTGRHFLDSGSAMGRHWEENQANPPWEQATFTVYDGFVTMNAYAYLNRVLSRNSTAVALEAGLYAYGRNGPGEGESWFTCMTEFAEDLAGGRVGAVELREMDLPESFIGEVLAAKSSIMADRRTGGSPSRRQSSPGVFAANTYNGEHHALSQDVQGVNFGGPYAEFAALQIHQGADARGGYTGPRVYRVHDCWYPGEFGLACGTCDWTDMESCVYGSDYLLHQSSVDEAELADALAARAPSHVTDDDAAAVAGEQAQAARDDDAYDGGVFHVADGCGGRVHYH